MSGVTKTCYPTAVQSVRAAMSKDINGTRKEAYCCYLSSVLYMIQALKDEAWEKKEIKDLCHDEAFKLYKLTEQSLGRARDILKEHTVDTGKGVDDKYQKGTLSSTISVPHLPVDRSSHGLKRNPNLSKSMVNLKSASIVSSLPTPPGYPTSSTYSRPKGFQAQNYDMFQAYRQRKSKDYVQQKYATANYNLSLFREAAEKRKIQAAKDKADHERMLKRQKEIQSEAERRWNQRESRSSRDKEYRRNLLATLLSYEETSQWPIRLRDNLISNMDDTSIIVKVVQTILTQTDHPLCKVLKGIQYEIYCNIEPLVKEFDSETDNDYLTPIKSINCESKSNTVIAPSVSTGNVAADKRTLDINASDTVTNENMDLDNKSSSLDTRFEDLEDDMFSSDDEDTKKEAHNPLYESHISTITSADETVSKYRENPIYETLEAYDIINRDTINSKEIIKDASFSSERFTESSSYSQLWKVQNDISGCEVISSANDDEGTYEALSGPQSNDPSLIESKYARLEPYEENIYEDVSKIVTTVIRSERISQGISPKELKRLDSNFIKTLDGIVQDILFGLDRLYSVMLLAYEPLDSPVGRDISYSTLESVFFKPLWPWLIRLFRIMNICKENALAEVMNKYKDCGPKGMDIRDKFTLQDKESPDSKPYQFAIDELNQLFQFTCPLEKLECTVRMSKAICHCVETHFSDKGEKAPCVGGDDLLPIVSYVVLKTNSQEIISECHALQEFVHDGYLMGEEGYCLATLHAAITNLLSYATPFT